MPATCLTDSIALGLAWYAFHLADRPATQPPHLWSGPRQDARRLHQRALPSSSSQLWIVYEAWQRLLVPEPVLGGPMLVVASLGLLVNIAGSWCCTAATTRA